MRCLLGPGESHDQGWSPERPATQFEGWNCGPAISGEGRALRLQPVRRSAD